MITVTIKNLDKFQQSVMRYPEVSVKNFNDAINRSLIQIQRDAGKLSPRDTGYLKANWELNMSFLKGVLRPLSKYAIFVHEGTKPHFPPIEAITPWARRHGIPPFLVARSIAKHGTQGIPFLQSSVSQNESFVNNNFEKALDKTLNQL